MRMRGVVSGEEKRMAHLNFAAVSEFLPHVVHRNIEGILDHTQ